MWGMITKSCPCCKRSKFPSQFIALKEPFSLVEPEICDTCYSRFILELEPKRKKSDAQYLEKRNKKETRLFRKFIKDNTYSNENIVGCLVFFIILILIILVFLNK